MGEFEESAIARFLEMAGIWTICKSQIFRIGANLKNL